MAAFKEETIIHTHSDFFIHNWDYITVQFCKSKTHKTNVCVTHDHISMATEL